MPDGARVANALADGAVGQPLPAAGALKDSGARKLSNPRTHGVRTTFINEARVRTIAHVNNTELFTDLIQAVPLQVISSGFEAHGGESLIEFYTSILCCFNAWLGFVLFTARYEADDWVFRATSLGSMLAAVLLACFAPGYEHLFALGYLANRVLLLLNYTRVACDRAEPSKRSSQWRMLVLGSVSVLWATGAFAPALGARARRMVLLCALAIDYVGPLAIVTLCADVPGVHTSHCESRFSRMMLILLSCTCLMPPMRAFVAHVRMRPVNGSAAAGLGPSFMLGVLALLFAYSIVRVYSFGLGFPRPSKWESRTWFRVKTYLLLYNHLPLVVALCALGNSITLGAVQQARASGAPPPATAGGRGALLPPPPTSDVAPPLLAHLAAFLAALLAHHMLCLLRAQTRAGLRLRVLTRAASAALCLALSIGLRTGAPNSYPFMHVFALVTLIGVVQTLSDDAIRAALDIAPTDSGRRPSLGNLSPLLRRGSRSSLLCTNSDGGSCSSTALGSELAEHSGAAGAAGGGQLAVTVAPLPGVLSHEADELLLITDEAEEAPEAADSGGVCGDAPASRPAALAVDAEPWAGRSYAPPRPRARSPSSAAKNIATAHQ